MAPVTTLTTLRGLFLHNDWARDRLLEAARSLSDEQFDQPIEMGPGSLRATLEHLCRTERWWLDRWQGTADPPAEPEPGLPVAELHDRFRAIAEERNEFLDDRDEAEQLVCTTETGRTMTLALSDMVLHVCNHGFHHRAQALNMLRRLGAEAPDIDFIVLRRDPSGRPEISCDLEVITRYYEYNDWACERVLDAAEPLDDAGLDRAVQMSLGSLRMTLLHIRDAEQWWLGNWSNEPAEAFQRLPGATSIAELRTLSARTATRRNELLATLADEDLGRIVRAGLPDGGELTFTMGDTMVQLCGHGTHHRAQALNMLRQLGVDGPDLDYVDFARQ
ncbi:MAG: DinB family protein [Planctomycetes bacterium]|nr:DinB family protein [Planctomycetota bacterium]